MNERIRELAKEATTYIEPTATSGEGWIFDKEKFAELIVRECVAICVSNALDDLDADNPRGASAKCAFDIKEHFGVEE